MDQFTNIHYLKCAQSHTRRGFKENGALYLVEEGLPYHDIVAVLPGMNSDHYKAVVMSAPQCALDLPREK